ncbi:hypothetical protein [Desulfogranum japonicum]|uniref:hypothetical protein n=1 Tax=Desulfogranum japonicum TaxID=231447 RepID=UPI00041C11D9|nr:hypothetical protein [Desulfogranum japonicum]
MNQFNNYFLLIFLFLLVGHANGAEITAFGPQQYVRTTGSPNIYTDIFSAEPGEARLVIYNGLKGEKSNQDLRVTSGVIELNGEVLFTHDDFKHKTYLLEIPITLLEENTIRVELESKPGTFLNVEIIQTIHDPIYDLVASNLQLTSKNCPDSVTFGLKLRNNGNGSLPAGVPISFYDGNPDTNGNLIGTTVSTTDLQPTDYEEISFTWPHPDAARAEIFAKVDDDGTGIGSYDQSDEVNNLISFNATLCQTSQGKSSLSGNIIDAVDGSLLPNVQVLLHVDDSGLLVRLSQVPQVIARGSFASMM